MNIKMLDGCMYLSAENEPERLYIETFLGPRYGQDLSRATVTAEAGRLGPNGEWEITIRQGEERTLEQMRSDG